MTTYTKINSVNLGRLNNAEYTFFMDRTDTLVTTATPEKLGISAAQSAALRANVARMTDIVAQSRMSDETALIAQTDKEADALVVYLMAALRTGKGSPVAAQKSAATTLYNATHPYTGCQNLPQGQQIQSMRGLLADLAKPDLAPHVATLGLAPVVASLAEVTQRYADLIDSRAASQDATRLDAGKTVRNEMDAQYDDMVTIAFATSLVTPTDESAAFVAAMNKLIADTDAAYNMRIAQMQAAAKK